MKTFLGMLTVLALIFTSCEGDPGPPGPPGFDGQDGLDAEYAKVVEITTSFDYSDDTGLWTTDFIVFPNDVVFLDGDAVLAYRLEDVVDGLDVWTPLPHNFFREEGTLQFLFNHTIGDIQFLIDGNYDLSDISTGFTDDQIFRYVLIPTEFAENFNGDFSNMDEVLSALQIDATEIQKVD